MSSHPVSKRKLFVKYTKYWKTFEVFFCEKKLKNFKILVTQKKERDNFIIYFVPKAFCCLTQFEKMGGHKISEKLPHYSLWYSWDVEELCCALKKTSKFFFYFLLVQKLHFNCTFPLITFARYKRGSQLYKNLILCLSFGEVHLELTPCTLKYQINVR